MNVFHIFSDSLPCCSDLNLWKEVLFYLFDLAVLIYSVWSKDCINICYSPAIHISGHSYSIQDKYCFIFCINPTIFFPYKSSLGPFFNFKCQSIFRLFSSIVPVYRWGLYSFVKQHSTPTKWGTVLKQNYFVAWIIHTKLNHIFELMSVPIIIQYDVFWSSSFCSWFSATLTVFQSSLFHAIFLYFLLLIRPLVYSFPFAPESL